MHEQQTIEEPDGHWGQLILRPAVRLTTKEATLTRQVEMLKNEINHGQRTLFRANDEIARLRKLLKNNGINYD